MPVLLLLVMITGVQQHIKLVLIFLVQSFKIILSTSSARLLILNPTVGPKRPPPLDPVFISNKSVFLLLPSQHHPETGIHKLYFHSKVQFSIFFNAFSELLPK